MIALHCGIISRCSGTKRCRSGFAMIMALTMVSLVAIGVLALTLMLRLEVGRTRTATNQTQLRQLLLGGAASATEALTRQPGRTDRITIALPQTLQKRAATLNARFQDAPDQTKHVIITARFGDAQANQTLVFSPLGYGWQLQSATLNRQR